MSESFQSVFEIFTEETMWYQIGEAMRPDDEIEGLADALYARMVGLDEFKK